MASIRLLMFTKPSWEYWGGVEEEEDSVKTDILRSMGKVIDDRMQQVAGAVEALQMDGWRTKMGLYEVLCHKEGMENGSLSAYLKSMGIDVSLVEMDDWDEVGWVKEVANEGSGGE